MFATLILAGIVTPDEADALMVEMENWTPPPSPSAIARDIAARLERLRQS
jgi:hypothetical protein